ncbi:MAG: M1 family aminopeptidase [Candidatus Electryonea clarkiae]|nr:M1 family aminopeptidase [Candidatus Electryonea clarkiae]MDP8285711.1 M1 family aminopeptidase [Candidatus Electryonea clarkiae]
MRKFYFFLLMVIFLSSFLMISSVQACPGLGAAFELNQKHPFHPQPKYVFGSGELDADSSHSYDAITLRATFVPDLEERTFEAEVTINAVILEEDIESIPVNLDTCTVEDVFINGETVEFNHVDDIISISLPDSIIVNDLIEIRIIYSGPLLTNLVFGGMVYHQASNVLLTFGEPFETRYWLACYDLPFDKLDTTSISVLMPDSFKVVSNGYLVSEEQEGDNILTTWENTDPIATYLISIAAHPYIKIESGNFGENEIPVNFWAYREDSSMAAYEFGRTGEMIDHFESLFGTYPFNKYDQAMAPIFNGWGAMEHQTCTTYGDRLVSYYGGRTFETVVAHELGHMWWGDMVSPITFAHMWLNEGFATYTETLWLEYLGDDEITRTHMRRNRDIYFQEDSERLRYPTFNPPPGYQFGRAIYQKGAWVLHMLRWLVGDEDFFEGLTLYGQTYRYGNAATDDFKQVIEEVSGQDLEDFFDQWIYQAGYPIYNFRNFRTSGNANDGYTAMLDLEQTQQNAPIFTTSLPIRVFGNGGDLIAQVEVADQQTQTLRIEGLDFEPSSYEFDPDRWMLCRYYPNSVDERFSILVPNDFRVTPAWPNPFNGATRFNIHTPGTGQLNVEVFDILGRRVARLADGIVFGGVIPLTWQPERNLSAGTYIISISAPGGHEEKRVLLVK